MLEYLKLFLPPIGYGILFSVVVFYIERFLITKGYIRGNPVVMIVLTFVTSLITYATLEALQYWLFWVFFLPINPIAYNRVDYVNACYRGRWWWMEEESPKK